MKDPAAQAETMRAAYQTYLKGRGGQPAQNVSARLQPDSAGEDTLAGMRGPYLQALPVANWSEQEWATFAKNQPLHPNITRAFHQEGFRRLYDFQERSIQRIRDGDDTVISASTGRGKTEAWLIPILDQIVRAKGSQDDSGSRTSTKALLMYPTKALAQDQFKRLLQILYRINRNLREKEWITVGIYDGDTPQHIYEDGAQGYLNKTFQHFDCPGANDDLSKCQSCGQGVFVERATDGFRLRPDKPECEADQPNDVPLDFVQLTRSELREHGADIILTNPDTVNYRLFNINAETEQQTFVYDPEFVVFDEVHTYDGLLGSYTATLMKRLRRLRERRDCDPLQVIGSSATVKNDKKLFRQISGASDITAVRERPRKLSNTLPESVPNSLTSNSIAIDEVEAAGRGDRPTPPQLGEVSLAVENTTHLDNERLVDQLSEELFDYYTQDNPQDAVTKVFQTLHQELRSKPRPPREFIEDCAERFEISTDEAETLVENFQKIGQFAGLLESRHHLFSWPLDGFYACSACDAVYRSPQDTCDACGGGFVSRATYCRTCGEEYIVANACSRCDSLFSYAHSEEGTTGNDEFRTCPTCAASGEIVQTHRVTFQPHQECLECGAIEPRSVVSSCDDCETDAPGVPTEDGGFVCRNPECETTWNRKSNCGECGSHAVRSASIPAPTNCSNCGSSHNAETLPTECRCGETVRNTRYVPWTCGNEECSEVYFTHTPPQDCHCGESTQFVKGGLYELAVTHRCQNCGGERLTGGDCGCDSPEYVTVNEPYRRFKTWDEVRSIRSPLDNHNAIPCNHGLSSSVIGDAYDELMRSPTNAAVTTSQYLLRDVLKEEGYDGSKLLAFSDSHRDMKNLDRAFAEPEADTALDQLVIAGVELLQANRSVDALDESELRDLHPGKVTEHGESDDVEWVSLNATVEAAYRLLEVLESELGGDDIRESIGLNIAESILGTSYGDRTETVLKSKIRRRAVRHVGERPYQGRVSLETDGLLNVRLRPDIELTDSEATVVAELVRSGNNEVLESLDVDVPDGRDVVVDRLVADNVLCFRDDNRVAFEPSAVEVSLPGDVSMQYDADAGEYHSQLNMRHTSDTDTIPCADTLIERSNSSHPRFSERAFTLTRSRVSMLLSRMYFGATPKMERRETEHLFRESSHPNFLSSGPTMEMGVDIGSLDSLLLYGTPPNMNAYLQRIGRAGRSTGSSLVHSVSQRNPIDYYYYDEPTELITTEKQPVPLNEHNERVLHISLTWGVLDYVASEFTIPWESTRHNINGGEEIGRRNEFSEEEREDAAEFTKLLASDISTLDLGNEESRLRPLKWILNDNEKEIRDHLKSLLAYAYCPQCHRRFATSKAGGECTECGAQLRDASEEYGDLIEDAIDAATEVFVNGYRNHANQIQERIETHKRRRQNLEAELEEAPPEEVSRLERDVEQASDRIDVLRSYLNDLAGEKFLTVLQDAFTEYAFNLRTASDSVGIEVIDESGEPERLGEDRSGRGSRLAIAELHPGAAYLHERRPYAVEQVILDDKTSADLREIVEKYAESAVEDIGYLATEFICTDCGTTANSAESPCGCSESNWQERRLFSLDSVEATLTNQSLPNGVDDAQAIYERSQDVQNTYARRQTEILDFDPTESFELVTDDGDTIGTLALGDYEVLEYTDSFRTKYQSGAVDDEATTFELCAEEECTGIIYEDDSEKRRCSVSEDHVVDEGSKAAYARFGYEYATEGVRLKLSEEGTEGAHTLAHGIRLALQKISGVTIRDINEYVGTDHVDVFDSLEGGAAVSRLLVEEQDGKYENFQSATSLMDTQFHCDCSDGCPRCLYQYGCATRNQPSSFNRDAITNAIMIGLRLRR